MNSCSLPVRGTSESSEAQYADVAAQTAISSQLQPTAAAAAAAAADVALPNMRLPGSDVVTRSKDSLPTVKMESVDTDSAGSLISSLHHASPPHEARSILSETQVALKLLVSNGASGLIIGHKLDLNQESS